MSALATLPTPNCIYVGLPVVPLNAPADAPMAVVSWVSQVAALTEPDEIRWWLDDRPASLPIESLVEASAPLPLTCSIDPTAAGDQGSWRDPALMRRSIAEDFSGCMRGRTMWIVPLSLGPVGGWLSRLCVEVTDSIEVARRLSATTWAGARALRAIATTARWLPVVRSASPFAAGRHRTAPGYVAQFPDSGELWARGDGGLAVDLSPVLGGDEGWLDTSLTLLRLTSTDGRSRHVAAAIAPDGLLLPRSLGSWKVSAVGSGRTWLRAGADGRLRATEPLRGANTDWGRDGVAVDAILLDGGAGQQALAIEAFDWEHAVLLAVAGAASGGRAATRGSLADRWARWLRAGTSPGARAPRVFVVGGPARAAGALTWLLRRLAGEAGAVPAVGGLLPEDADLRGDLERWTAIADDIGDALGALGVCAPDVLEQQLWSLRERIVQARLRHRAGPPAAPRPSSDSQDRKDAS
ncbi:hypothetical protein [Propionicimonas sp.]|uniref:hypothetical protein n=1 Tax=Propionicimonas sp. TaxID=1955623 RepID=UPI0039E2603F